MKKKDSQEYIEFIRKEADLIYDLAPVVRAEFRTKGAYVAFKVSEAEGRAKVIGDHGSNHRANISQSLERTSP